MRSSPPTCPAMRRSRVSSLRLVSGLMHASSRRLAAYTPTGYLSSGARAGYARGVVSTRKPAGLSFESWVEQQIREAEHEGRFDALPGAGRPLATDDADDPHWWTKQLLRREQVEFVPPALAIRRSVEKALAALPKLHDEARVREVLVELNAEIRRLNATVHAGPPTTQAPLDVEEIVARWWRAREEQRPK